MHRYGIGHSTIQFETTLLARKSADLQRRPASCRSRALAGRSSDEEDLEHSCARGAGEEKLSCYEVTTSRALPAGCMWLPR
jgi:hypothetical protein